MNNLLNNKIFISTVILISAFILTKIISKVYNKITKKHGKKIHVIFLKNIINIFIIIIAIINLLANFKWFKDFSQTILMSSSLIVVVLGFILQEGLSNIVHGFIISVFKPFEVGDRIEANIDGNTISGIVKSINLRHTTITTTADNAKLIVPNSKLDLSTFKNFSNGNEYNRYPIQVDITYDCACDKKKRNLAKNILKQAVLNNPRTIDTRTDKNEPIFLKTELKDSSVRFTIFVTTRTFEENYKACTEITEKVIDDFTKNDISFAFPHMEISMQKDK